MIGQSFGEVFCESIHSLIKGCAFKGGIHTIHKEDDVKNHRKFWLVLIFCIAVLLSGMVLFPVFALENEAKFGWRNYAYVYQTYHVYLPLIFH
jgi:hypothetical protein